MAQLQKAPPLSEVSGHEGEHLGVEDLRWLSPEEELGVEPAEAGEGEELEGGCSGREGGREAPSGVFGQEIVLVGAEINEFGQLLRDLREGKI